MTKSHEKKLFEKYNPAGAVVRCPVGRAKMRKPLDLYAKAAVNLYGIIRRDEFVEIFNSQNDAQTNADEVYTILLPNVFKSPRYGFYKEYIVHYVVLDDFSWVENLEQHQAGKPRYVPPKEEFLKHEEELYDDNPHWKKFLDFMWNAFAEKKNIMDAFEEIKVSAMRTRGIKKLGAIMQEYNLVFTDQEQMQSFLDSLTLAMNNARIWENKGHTPEELMKRGTSNAPQEPFFYPPKKTGPNQSCPCGSGKNYKKCCALVGKSRTTQLSHDECKLFYESWYKLLDFINRKHKKLTGKNAPVCPAYYGDPELVKIREKLWAKPRVINEFLNSTDRLSDEEISLLKSWEKNHIKGEFFLMKYEPDYAVFMRLEKGSAPRLYAVKGMAKPIAEVLQQQLPVMLQTVLLPFKDKIVYDCYIASHNISFGSGILVELEEEFAILMGEYGLITKMTP